VFVGPGSQLGPANPKHNLFGGLYMNDKFKISRTASRRSFLKKSAVVAAVAATGPAIVNSRVLAASREVKVFAWVDYVNEDMIDGFEKETGITVNLSTFGSNDEAEQKN